jgi:hypothetical protein
MKALLATAMIFWASIVGFFHTPVDIQPLRPYATQTAAVMVAGPEQPAQSTTSGQTVSSTAKLSFPPLSQSNTIAAPLPQGKVLGTSTGPTPDYVTQDYLASVLSQLQSSVRLQLYGSGQTYASGGVWNIIAASNKIDNLSGTTITNPTISGGSISGTSIPVSNLAGVLPVTSGGTGWASIHVGSLIFGGGSSAVATSSNLYWDNSNGRLGIGTSSPLTTFSIQGTAGANGVLNVASSTGASVLYVDASGKVGINTSSPIDLLHIPGLANPVIASSTSSGVSQLRSVYVQGRYAYVASYGNSSLVIFDIFNPGSPVMISSISTGLDNPWDVYVSGRYAYVASYGNSSFVIFDVSNPTSPVEVSSISTGLSQPRSVYVQGRYAYVASYLNNSLVIFDIANPVSPVKVGALTLAGPTVVRVQGLYAYVGDYNNNAFNVVDISNPASPSLVGSTASGLSFPNSISIQGRYAYVVNYTTNTLVTLDISNPTTPVVVGSVSVGGSNGLGAIYVQGRYGYVADSGHNLLHVFDLSNPALPVEVGSTSSSLNAPVSVYIQGRYAYVANLNNSSLTTFNIGGTYIQSGDFGTLQATSLSLDNNLQAIDGAFSGGLTVGNSLNVGGSFSLTASPSNAASQNYSIFSLNTASSTSPLFAMLYNGNVGIGNTAPAYTLDVKGQAGASSPFNVASSTGTSELMVSNVGNVGIGTPSPAHALDVFGDCIAWMGTCINTTAPANVVSYVGGVFRFSANANFTTASATRYLGAANTAVSSTDVARVVVTRAGTLQNLYVKASANTWSGTVTFTVMKNGSNTAITAQLTGSGVTSASDTTHTVSVAPGDTLALSMVTSSGSGTITVPLAASFEEAVTTNVFSSQWVTNGTTISYTGGNVGVGTTTPWGNLSIAALSGNTAPLFTISTSTASATSTALLIDSNGNVGIGTSSPTTALQVNGSITPNTTNVFTVGNATYLWNAVYATNGTIQTSDARLKENVNNLSYGLSDILKLRPVSFTWIAQPQQGTRLGFIAQEVQPILPETVNVGDDANHTLGLTYTEFIPVIVNAIKEIASVTGTFRDALVVWFANAGNGIGDFFANRVFGNQLCAKKSDGSYACVTGDQLAAAVLGQASTGGGASGASSDSAAADASASSTPPVIEVTGNNPAIINVGDTYSDLGAKITGPTADLNLGIHTFVGATPIEFAVIDTSAPATYHLYYVATDQNGLTATSSRTVIVQAATTDSASTTATTDTASTTTDTASSTAQ